jgi:Fe2+ transport system protein B
MVCGHPSVVVLTFWDKVSHLPRAQELLIQLRTELGVPVIALDARKITESQRDAVLSALKGPSILSVKSCLSSISWLAVPKQTLFDKKAYGVALSLLLLFTPAVAATWVANTVAGFIDPLVEHLTSPLSFYAPNLPSLWHEILFGNYGLVTMGPLLFVWAIPTVLLYSVFLGAYKASGLLDTISVAMHPISRKVGLSGRDIIRVIMGYGCNVPAVISTRACSTCSRSTTISTIAFGSVCSYQFSATVGVFAAARHPILILPFMVYVLITTIVMARLSSAAIARSPLNILVVDGHTYLQWPTLSSVWREGRASVHSFLRKAVPIFCVISIIASLLAWWGVLQAMSRTAGPLMTIFHLPKEAALPTILASIRKDGLLILARTDAVMSLTRGQLLTAVYLAGQFVPCLVTVLTIAKECSLRVALKVVGNQIIVATMFSFLLAQVVWLLHL